MFKRSIDKLTQNIYSSITYKVKSGFKQLAIPSVMMTGYFFFQAKKMFSAKNILMQESKSRKLYLEGCEALQEGEMKHVKYGQKDTESILVVRYEGKLRALSNSCPHFGAPMHTGVMIDNIVKCPWHGASFDVVTGETDIAPSIDNLPVYEVHFDEKGYYVDLPEEVKGSVPPKLSKRDPDDKRKFVIIGGGPAGLNAAEVLRQNGYTGEIVILSKEAYVPYDRTVLSKFIPPSIDRIVLRKSDFMKEYDMDIVNNVTVTEVDNKQKVVKLNNGEEVNYDKLLIASGGAPVVPKIPGNDLENVYLLRTFDDIQKISSACKNAKNILVIGGSFIGMESACTLKRAFPNANVTVVEQHQTPFFMTLGKEIGLALQNLHEEKGVKFSLNHRVKEVRKDKVILDDNTTLPADVVLMGVGIVPNTEFIKHESLAMDRLLIKTDLYLNTSDENVFAAGDIVSVPYFKTGDYINFGHYVSAQQQGAVAALNMLGKKVPYEYVPFFWTRHWDKSLQYTGYGTVWDDVFIEGDLKELKFVAYYIKDNKIVGFAAMNSPNAANIMYEAFRNDKVPRATLLKSGDANLETIKNSLKNVKVKCLRADCACAKRKAAQQQQQLQQKH